MLKFFCNLYLLAKTGKLSGITESLQFTMCATYTNTKGRGYKRIRIQKTCSQKGLTLQGRNWTKTLTKHVRILWNVKMNVIYYIIIWGFMCPCTGISPLLLKWNTEPESFQYLKEFLPEDKGADQMTTLGFFSHTHTHT